MATFKDYALAICITTYNRPLQVLRLVHRLSMTKSSDTCIVVRPDGGDTELLDKMIPLMKDRGVFYFKNDINEGVYKSKVRTLAEGVKLADYVAHCDDDDFIDEHLVREFVENMVVKCIPALQMNTSRLLEKESEVSDKLTYQAYKRKEITACLNGLIMESAAIQEAINGYFELDISTWTNKTESWGDDTLIPGALLANVEPKDVYYSLIVAFYQEYLAQDQYHICFDPEVYKKTKKYCHKYFYHIPLKNSL